jgi:ABC-2 type transport system ATP-binding protein
MIEAKGLSLFLGKNQILKDVNFRLEEKALILGPNGSGKSSLLKVLSGFYRYKGSVKIDGKELMRDLRDYTELSTNLPEAYYLARDVEDLISIYSEIKGSDHETFLKMMEETGVNFKKRSLFSLSLGERTLTLTALAFSSKPKVIAVDEPFENLDKNRRKIVIQWIRKYGKEGFIVTHEIGLLKEFDTWKAYLMIEGRLYGPVRIIDLMSSKLVKGRRDDSLLELKIRQEDYSLIKEEGEENEILDLNRVYDYI